MSNHFVEPSASPPGRRLRRLQFRSITDQLEEQATVEISAATPDRGKQRGEFLPARQQVQAGLPPTSSSGRNNQYKVPVPSQIEAIATQKVSTPTFAPTNVEVIVPGQNRAASGVSVEEESQDFDLHFRMIGGIDA